MEGEELTKDMLLRNGWEQHGNIMVLRANVRFGWYPATGKLIVGYTETPFSVTSIDELQGFLDVFRTGRKIER